ncbi:MAG: hypothetical protein WD048_05580 [Chitinophagales bacterium]
MNRVKDIPKESIKLYVNHDIELLYSILSFSVAHDEDTLYSPKDDVNRALQLLQGIEDKLKSKICKEWKYCIKRHDPDLQDTITLIGTLSDVIATTVIGLPPTLISIILFKKGLNTFCKCDPHKKPTKQKK